MMSQEVEKHGASKEGSNSSGSSLDLGSLRETRVHHHHHHHHHQSISKLVEDIRKGQDEVQKIRKDLEKAQIMQAEQIDQQRKLMGMMEQIQAAMSVFIADDSMKI